MEYLCCESCENKEICKNKDTYIEIVEILNNTYKFDWIKIRNPECKNYKATWKYSKYNKY